MDSNKDKVTFADDEIMTRLLENYFESVNVPASVWSATNLVVDFSSSLSDLNARIEQYTGAVDNLQDIFIYDAEDMANYTSTSQTDTTENDGNYREVYVLNSTIYSEEDALKQVALYLDDLKMATEGTTDGGVKNVDYSYTGTAAAIEAESEGGTKSVWVVAVTITRDSAAKETLLITPPGHHTGS